MSEQDFRHITPANPVFAAQRDTNWRLDQVADLLNGVGTIMSQLVDLARDEREARLASDRRTRRWAWATLVVSLITLAVAIMGVIVGVL